MLTIVTGGSHNSSGLMLSNVISFAFRSPGEQETQSIRGPFGFGLDIYTDMKYHDEYRL